MCVCMRVLFYQVSSRTKYNLYLVNYYDRIGLGWALWVISICPNGLLSFFSTIYLLLLIAKKIEGKERRKLESNNHFSLEFCSHII